MFNNMRNNILLAKSVNNSPPWRFMTKSTEHFKQETENISNFTTPKHTHAQWEGVNKKRKGEIDILSSRALSDTLTLHLKTHIETDFENIYLKSKLWEQHKNTVFHFFFPCNFHFQFTMSSTK